MVDSLLKCTHFEMYTEHVGSVIVNPEAGCACCQKGLIFMNTILKYLWHTKTRGGLKNKSN